MATPLKIKFKKLSEEAKAPYHGSDYAAGYDLTATSKAYDKKHGVIVYGTSLAVEIPKGYVGLLFPRSSVYKTDLTLSNCVGVIDSDYRGEVMFKFRTTRFFTFWNLLKFSFNSNAPMCLIDKKGNYNVGDRVGQLIIIKTPLVEYEEAAELSDTKRGKGGYGSSGK